MRNRMLLVAAALLSSRTLPADEVLQEVPDRLLQAIFDYSYPKDLRDYRFLTIREDGLEALVDMPLADFRNLEAVVIELTEDPEAPDDVKDTRVARLEMRLALLGGLRACPDLQCVIVRVGEYLFVRSSDHLPYAARDPRSREKAAGVNRERFAARFAGPLAELLPGKTLYVQDWGW